MKLSELAQKLGGELLGDGSVEIASVASIETAQPGTIVRVDAPAYLEAAEKTPASLPAAAAGPVASAPPPAVELASSELDELAGELRDDETETKQALEALAAELDAVEARTLARARAYVKRLRAGLLPIAGGFEELVDHASNLERLRRALGRDQELTAQLGARRLELVERLVSLQRQRQPLEAHRASLSRSRAAVLAERDRALAFEQAFSGVQGEASAVYAASVVEPSAPGSAASRDFAALRGELPLPLAGRTRVVGKSSRGRGAEIHGGARATVQAVHAGRVSFVGPYHSFERAVVVEHDGGYATLTAGLGETLVAVGQSVAAGAPLGSLRGASGGEAFVYFEVQRDGEVLPAGPWFGL